MRGDNSAAARGSSNSGEKEKRTQTHLSETGAARAGKKRGTTSGVLSPSHDSATDNTEPPSVQVAAARQHVMSIDKDSSVTSHVMGTTISSATGSRSGVLVTDPWVILQPQPPPFLRGWAAQRGSTRDSNNTKTAEGCVLPRPTTKSTDKMPTRTNFCQVSHDVLTANTVEKDAWFDDGRVRKLQRLELHFASPSERKQDFTRVVDPYAETMRRLEEEHHRRFRRALYRLQQVHPDPWWRLQSSAYYDVGVPDLLACDDNLFFSRVAGEVRDAGITWLSLKNATL
ncbi:hypothetical protein MOQ_000488 [Trypanosoma cruzi marinkellei]|uniref:Uncharacterized protein n=1 Tax=Trypanosoma cruzi marinkellei TaxID=85056 RepID=K2MVL5_TRYCR|nr:hypothetical protein MOQ_000488 [Trypanosoma cruzi marinkellei]